MLYVCHCVMSRSRSVNSVLEPLLLYESSCGQCAVPYAMDSSFIAYTMSISPPSGHVLPPAPSVQNAGHAPLKQGSFMRASIRPN